MSPRRADKKRLNSADPRKRSQPEKQKKAKTPRYRIDAATMALTVVAVILLVLVLFMLFKRPGTERNTGNLVSSDGPVIERVENPAANIEEPVPELGIPEARVEPEDPVESTENNSAGTNTATDSTARLFFVKVSDEGNIGMKSVLRSVPSTASPLTTAINALIEGPRPGELSNDVLSLVPDNSVLIGARVEASVAFLDFTEQFRFNALGIEGYRAQVEQIVFTATEFSTVEKVQFLIEGQRIDFLGGEGFYVGSPIGREDF